MWLDGGYCRLKKTGEPKCLSSQPEEDYPEAKSQADNIAYLFKLLHVSSYIQDSVYKSLAVDAAVLSATIEEAVNGDLEPEE